MRLADLGITPTVETIDLGDWNAAAQGKLVYVWVDPPRQFLREREAFSREYAEFLTSLAPKPTNTKGRLSETLADKKAALAKERQSLEERQARLETFLKEWNRKVYDWYAKLWSKGPEGTHWTVDELKEWNEGNPQLLAWLFERSKSLLDSHGRAEKNA